MPKMQPDVGDSLMKISEKQIMHLISLLHESRKIIMGTRIAIPQLGDEYLTITSQVLNQINNQQSEELKTIE